jgi:hypothetical protein
MPRCIFCPASLVVVGAGFLVGCAPTQPALEPGARAYSYLGCGPCHGEHRQGTAAAPPLLELSERWNEQTLREYLADPHLMIERTPRLKYLAERYPIAMPPVTSATPEQLEAIVKLLLEE